MKHRHPGADARLRSGQTTRTIGPSASTRRGAVLRGDPTRRRMLVASSAKAAAQRRDGGCPYFNR